jgi:photosystem II stability/assembly factor-like uncharacterized protein
MIDATTGWALTNKAILRTTDGGIHWRVVSPPQTHFIPEYNDQTLEDRWGRTAAFLTSFNAWVVAPQPDRNSVLIFRTVDGGQTWQHASIKSIWLKQITAIDGQYGWIVSIPPRALESTLEIDIYRTIDGGKTWMKVAGSTPPTNTPYGVLPPNSTNIAGLSFLNPSMRWATGATNTFNFAWFYVTYDGGASWQNQFLPLPPNEAPAQLAINPPIFFPESKEGILPVAFFNEKRWRINFYTTKDAGATWNYTNSISLSTTGASHRNLPFLDKKQWVIPDTHPENLWRPLLHVSGDEGYSWTSLYPKTETTVTNIVSINMISSRIGLALGTRPLPNDALDSPQEDDATLLLKTDDGGQTWIKVPYIVL